MYVYSSQALRFVQMFSRYVHVEEIIWSTIVKYASWQSRLEVNKLFRKRPRLSPQNLFRVSVLRSDTFFLIRAKTFALYRANLPRRMRISRFAKFRPVRTFYLLDAQNRVHFCFIYFFYICFCRIALQVVLMAKV